MTTLTLDAQLGRQVDVDVCIHCQAFWFDQFESLQLSPTSTLKLMKFIGQHSLPKPSLADTLRCPRCASELLLTHDRQRNVPFSYWRCDSEHGRFISFLEFLKEKNFIHPLSPEQIGQLRQNIQIVNCSNCGAAIDLQKDSVCSYCHSPISMLDMKQPEQLLAQLQHIAAPNSTATGVLIKRPFATFDPATSLTPFASDHAWWRDAATYGLVQAGLNVVSDWLVDLTL
jgi:hypothetical protein